MKTEPESITGSDQNSQSILNQPEAHFGEVGTLSDTVHTDKRYAIRHACLVRGQWRRKFCANGKEEIGRRFRC